MVTRSAYGKEASRRRSTDKNIRTASLPLHISRHRFSRLPVPLGTLCVNHRVTCGFSMPSRRASGVGSTVKTVIPRNTKVERAEELEIFLLGKRVMLSRKESIFGGRTTNDKQETLAPPPHPSPSIYFFVMALPCRLPAYHVPYCQLHMQSCRYYPCVSSMGDFDLCNRRV